MVSDDNSSGFDEEAKEAYRARLKKLRRLHNMSQTEFARFVGIPYKKWNHYERGYPLSRESAFILTKKLEHFSIEWLWWGKTASLPENIVHRLEAFDKENDAKPKPAPAPTFTLLRVQRRISKTDKKRK